ncbi:MAG: DUF4321 domain-containing protein [Clostridia bacterium]|nr:DUF4321 domain-containing protein [Clostridia bacterium]
MKGYGASKSPWVLVVLVLIGAILGSLAGASFSSTFPILKASQSIGFPATTFDLVVARISLGLQINLNLAAAAGAVLAWLVYRRL